jgi:hypothetical protein
MEIVDGLCEICSHILSKLDLFIDKFDDDFWSSHHNSVLELRKSAKNGCSLCALFVSDANYAFSSIPVPLEHLEIYEGNSETEPDTSKADQKIGGGEPKRAEEFNEGDTEVCDRGTSGVQSLDIQPGSNSIDSPYTKQRTTGRVHFMVCQDRNEQYGHLT